MLSSKPSIVALAVCLGWLSCGKVNLHHILQSTAASSRFLAPSIFPSTSLSLLTKSIPTASCCHHHISQLGWCIQSDVQFEFFFHMQDIIWLSFSNVFLHATLL
ncbi:hypothetical protein AMECASPLE_007785 [Ameca splendens]|uniref:Secreted protein n=1 Tax=Ameca splendens TaxID=208324 RepID=A0ABV0Z8K7_9TELE